MRISDWSSDVCSSDLIAAAKPIGRSQRRRATSMGYGDVRRHRKAQHVAFAISSDDRPDLAPNRFDERGTRRSEEHTSELQSLMRISYAVFCLTKKKQ